MYSICTCLYRVYTVCRISLQQWSSSCVFRTSLSLQPMITNQAITRQIILFFMHIYTSLTVVNSAGMLCLCFSFYLHRSATIHLTFTASSDMHLYTSHTMTCTELIQAPDSKRQGRRRMSISKRGCKQCFKIYYMIWNIRKVTQHICYCSGYTHYV